MPLPFGSIALTAGEPSRRPKPAYLIRFPEDAWSGIKDAAESGFKVSISLNGTMTLHIPNHLPLPLESLPTGSSSEIHVLSSTSAPPTLSLRAIANAKLTVPISSASSARAADKLRAQNDAMDKERKERADRVNGVKKSKVLKDVAMVRTQSSPALSNENGNVGSGGGAGGSPTIPLKTRVVQLLALGPTAVENIVLRVGGVQQDVMRVVNVVGRQNHPGRWTLQPSQYSKVKIGSWKYTHAEKIRVVRLARQAFDELGLAADADERIELARKEAEMESGASEEKAANPLPVPELLPTLPKAVPPAATAARKKTPQTFVGKQMAKFVKEKRASSLPNVKKVDDARVDEHKRRSTSPIDSSRDRAGDIKEGAVGKKERSDVLAGKRKRDEKRKESPVFTSSESDDGRRKKRIADYSSSSSEDGPQRGRSTVPIQTSSRKLTRPEMKLNGYANNHRLSVRGPQRDPVVMRDRYEELFPAYQQLTRKLAKVHRAAEDGEDMGMGREVVEGMVEKWQRWHAELAGIRVCFGDGEGR